MPSMHVAVCVIYVMAARGTHWFMPSVLFGVLIGLGSIHFGYHYLLDGLCSIAVASLCWGFAKYHFRF